MTVRDPGAHASASRTGAGTPPPEPPAALRLRVRPDGVELRFCHWPRPGAPRLLLVHGIGMGHSVYDRFIAEVAPHAEVLAVDLPGFGGTARPPGPLPLPRVAELLGAALEELGLGPVVAAGHSMGAQVVAELAARAPRLVTGVILIAPSVNAAERSIPAQGFRMLQDLAEGEPWSVLRRGARTYLQAGIAWYVSQLREMVAHRIEACLPRVTQPALVLRGAGDRVCPRGWAIRLTALLPRGEMRQIPERGHEALISSGDPVARIVLDWIADRVPRGGVPGGAGARDGAEAPP